MQRNPGRRAVVFVLLIVLCVIGHPAIALQDSGNAPPQSGATEGAPGATRITALLLAPTGQAASDHLALNDKLAVVVDPVPAHPAEQYVLFLNDTEVKGLAPPDYATLQNGQRALVFKLVRNSDNSVFWRQMLGSPTRSHVRFTVGLGERAEPCSTLQPCKSPNVTIRGVEANGKPLGFDFLLISWGSLALAVAVVVGAVALIYGHARNNTTLRDNLLPQLPPQQQTYSLGRWQMAFWFVLVFGSFVFLYVLLWDYNTVSTQALALMGISSATALAAVAVDAAKDSPADAVNRALQALGLYTHADVLRIGQELNDRKAQLARAAADAHDLAGIAHRRLAQLQAEIQDRLNILQAYTDKTKPFVSQGWLKDLTTDINGPTLHRIQVLCWTVALGFVFIFGVYRDLAMPPDFSATLLALMGISSAGYVGFKWPEKNN